jgi:hypothetical protein
LNWAATHDVATKSDQRISGSMGLTWRTGPLRLSSDATFGRRLRPQRPGVCPPLAPCPPGASLNVAAVYRVTGLGHHPLDIRFDVLNALNGPRRLQDGTGLAGGLPQWSARRGIFIGLEQTLDGNSALVLL